MLQCAAFPRTFIRILCASILKNELSPSPAVVRTHRPASRLRRGYANEAALFRDAPAPNPNLDVGFRNPYVPRSNVLTKQDEPFSRTSLELEVRWLRDPLKLGDHTVSLLRQDQYVKAQAIVRLASKDVQCTVSWNQLIDYTMSKGKVADAVTLYNEMKKRAQLPDAYTFTILFRGFSRYPKFPLSVSRALHIYQSMFAEKSPVKPSIIHTNAVLKVYALAGDVDGLLNIAAQLPTRGNAAPDNITFTTILNAIRNIAAGENREKTSPVIRDEQFRIVGQGKRLWEEIRERWAKGDLKIDEELVCAMGRLLLEGNHDQSCHDILSLLEQTMGIPRQISRSGGSVKRDSNGDSHSLGVSDTPDLLDGRVSAHVQDKSDAKDPLNPKINPFALLPVNDTLESPYMIRPCRNTLSLVLDACLRTHMVRAAQNYWGLLTDPSGIYNISPDAENYHMYLRLLRVQRASKLALELIDDMRQGTLGPSISPQSKTFRIGLSSCVRDRNNQNSLVHASRLINLMYEVLEAPDARTLGMYLDLAVTQPSIDWRILMNVIRTTIPGIRNLRSRLAYDPEEGRRFEDDLKGLVKSFIGAVHVVWNLGKEAMSEEEVKMCKEQRSESQAWITRMANRDAVIERQANKSGHKYLKGKKLMQVRTRDDEFRSAHETVDEMELKRKNKEQFKRTRRANERVTRRTWKKATDD